MAVREVTVASDVAWDDLQEQALLGLAIQFPEQCRDALLGLEPDDWYRPAHQELATVLCKMFRTGQSVDVATVTGQILAQGLTRHWDAVKIFNLTELAWRPESASQIASRLRELSGRRKLSNACQEALQRLQSLSTVDEMADVRTATARLREACDAAEATATAKDLPVPRGMGDFLQVEDKREWLVPNLLERMDRTIITGPEGGGKSVLCSQIAACLAGHVHPFSGRLLPDFVDPVRVLVIDCENSDPQSRRRYRWVIDRVRRIRQLAGADDVDWNEQMHIDTKPAGINLLDSKDVAWLEHCLTATAPDLLVLGPLYKLHHENPNDETFARELVWILDNLRERHGFALLTEAHAGNTKNENGHRDLRPIGSSLWRRWPEFGFGLQRAEDDPGKPRAELVDVIAWRGMRDTDRLWPVKLRTGMNDQLPWLPTGDDNFDSSVDY